VMTAEESTDMTEVRGTQYNPRVEHPHARPLLD
jgi:hypothetical protein